MRIQKKGEEEVEKKHMSDKLKEMTEKNRRLERLLEESNHNNRKLKVSIISEKMFLQTKAQSMGSMEDTANTDTTGTGSIHFLEG